MSKQCRIRKNYITAVVALLLAFVMVFSVNMISVFADTTKDEQAMATLQATAAQKISDNSYPVEGGGTLKGSQILVQEGKIGDQPAYDIDEDAFNQLNSKGQTQVVQDIAQAANNKVASDKEKDATNPVTAETVQNWWKQLQTKEGVGSKFMTVILENTKPDFVSANRIYSPFSGIVGTVMGLGAILIMAFIGIVIVADLSYIVIPPVRMLVDGEGSNGKERKAFLISHDAIQAVEEAEGSSDGNGGHKQALAIYFKHRVVALIVLGICLLYLVQGQIYTLVGYVLDLVSGFLGF